MNTPAPRTTRGFICSLTPLILGLWALAGPSRAQPEAAVRTAPPPTRGPLRVHTANPRYFAEASGRAVLLTGSHTWNNLQDMGTNEPPAAFDFPAYLDFLNRHSHNFVRLWRWELFSWNTEANREERPHHLLCGPHPWARTGPGLALDGKPKFDLTRFDGSYFERLRSRVTAARDRGIYVSIMLFEGWGLQFVADAWKAHPFHPSNSLQGVAGDANADGKALEIHTLQDPGVTALQEAYVRKVIDTVNDLDNVLFEISNENHPASTDWQYHFIRFIKEYEMGKPAQHPVGMTFQYRGGQNRVLFASPADWISPNPDAEGGFDFRTNPPPAATTKVVLTDTDHLWGIGGDVAWVWKSFTRGLNPIFMDPYDGSVLWRGSEETWQAVRKAMGVAARLAASLDLATLLPRPALASTGFCLARTGEVYVVFIPGEPEVTVNLAGVHGDLAVEWIHPVTGKTVSGGRIPGGGVQTLEVPRGGGIVLHLRRVP